VAELSDELARLVHLSGIGLCHGLPVRSILASLTNVLAETTLKGFPWPLIPGFVGFFIGFFVQFRLKYHVDREKVLQLKDMSELYTQGLPPRKILTERGQYLYLWFYAGGAIFGGSIITCMILYAR
jgi:hypothetical protein